MVVKSKLFQSSDAIIPLSCNDDNEVIGVFAIIELMLVPDPWEEAKVEKAEGINIVVVVVMIFDMVVVLSLVVGSGLTVKI